MSYRLRYTVGPASRSSSCIGSGSSRTSWLNGSTSLVGVVPVTGAVVVTAALRGCGRSEIEDEAVIAGARDADVHAVVRVALLVVEKGVAVVRASREHVG